MGKLELFSPLTLCGSVVLTGHGQGSCDSPKEVSLLCFP